VSDFAGGNIEKMPGGVREVNMGIGELNAHMLCSNPECQKLEKFGVILQVNGKVMGIICGKCMAVGITRYQEVHPNEQLIQTDIYVEAPDLGGQIDELIKRTLPGYNIGSSDRFALVDAIQTLLDGNKFNEMGGESR
jgi:hypothetical protein